MRKFSKAAAFFFYLAVLLSPSFSYAVSTYDVLSEMPVQHNGRIKPFYSFAREVSMLVTGKSRFEGKKPVELVWGWMAHPKEWSSQPLIPVTDNGLRQTFGLSVIHGRVSPEVVLGHQPFLDQAQKAMNKRSKKDKLSAEEKKQIDIYERAVSFQEIAEGLSPGWVAHPEDPRVGWLPIQGFSGEEGRKKLSIFFPEEIVGRLDQSAQTLLNALKKDFNSSESLAAAQGFRNALQELFNAGGIALDEKVLGAENTYNRLQPFHWAWICYLLAVVLLALTFFSGTTHAGQSTPNVLSNIATRAGLLVFLMGFGIHAYGFYLRCVIAGRPPVTNMYESVIWVSWAVAFFSLILFSFSRALMIPLVSSLVASLALILAQSFPALMDSNISPLVPVLRSNYWLTIHVLTITLSYGAFALAWGLGHAAVFNFAFRPEKIESQTQTTQYVYRALQIGVILLATGTVLGGVWANYSWGRFWGWDPKETWALIALLGYLVVLHGRFAGWLGGFGLAVGSVVAFLGVVMAWYGVNFVLAAGLHSYGFGGGGAPYVFSVAILDLLIIGACALLYKKRTSAIPLSS